MSLNLCAELETDDLCEVALDPGVQAVHFAGKIFPFWSPSAPRFGELAVQF